MGPVLNSLRELGCCGILKIPPLLLQHELALYAVLIAWQVNVEFDVDVVLDIGEAPFGTHMSDGPSLLSLGH